MRPKSDSYRDVRNKGLKMSCSVSNEQTGSDSGKKNYVLSCSPINAVILHPSFLCPALKKTGDDLNLFVLGDKNFNKTFQEAEGCDGNKAGPSVPGAVNFYLKIVTWPSKDNTRHAPAPLFTSTAEAVSNIEVYYLWQASDLDNGVLTDKDGKAFAQIHPDVLKQYQDRSLNSGFQIVIKNLPNDAPGLYDISWMNYERSKTEDESGYFYELQDQYLNDFNTTYRSQYHPLHCDVSDDKCPTFTEEPTELQSYHPLYISNKPCLDIGHLSDVHVSSRQHLFTQSKAKLIDGEGEHHSDDIGSMVNTSYTTLKGLMNEMSKKSDLLIFTGDLIDYNRNYNPNNSIDKPEELNNSSGIWKALNLDNLGNDDNEKRYPLGIDSLIIYELFRWYYKTHNKPIMLISGNHEAYTLPYGISPRVKILRSFNATYNRFHKLTVEQVIQKSSRLAKEDADDIKDAEKSGKGPNIYDNRANEGIPADHNLTIPEAILMYGPDYARVVMSASYDFGGEKNFRPENLKWFFHIFTPLTSFYQTYGDQCFIGLGWGDDERFVDHIPKVQGEWKAGGFLPRSVEGVTDSQLKILNQALEAPKTQTVLCSHFTYINYNTSRPIGEQGKVSTNSNYGRHDYGTFETNRSQVYPVVKSKIQYALSGHSHRSGLYQFGEKLKSPNPRTRTKAWKVSGQAAKNGKFNPSGGTRLLVAASGGPIPVQNYKNELYNWGLDVPSGNYIKFISSTEQEIGVIASKLPNAKPRLAVALDYADIFLRDDEKGGVFERFESHKKKEPFAIKISEQIMLNANNLIDSITLIIYQKDGKQIRINCTTETTKENTYELMIRLEQNADKHLYTASKKYMMGLIDITLKSGNSETTNYNTNKHWVFPIELINRQKEAIDNFEHAIEVANTYDGGYVSKSTIETAKNNIRSSVNGYRVQRHSLYGEIPDFRFYRDVKPDEYDA